MSKLIGKKISIIVPVYNVEDYIERCLYSLVNQTYKNIEIIVINDGSTDKSLEIAKKFCEKDSRIKIYTKKNGGLSAARNFGLKKITGDYVMFVDSDDWLELKALKQLSKYMNDYDILCFNYIIENNNNVEVVNPKRFDFIPSVNNYILGQPSACTKMYKSSLFLDNNIKFDLGIHYEDLALIPSLYKYTNKIKFLDEALYHYYIRSNSIMHKVDFSNKIDDKFVALELLKSRIEKKFILEYNYIVLKQLCIIYVLEIIKYKKEIYLPRINKIVEYIKENNIDINNIYFSKEPSKNKLFVFCVMHKAVWLLKFFWSINKIVRKNSI